jgi:hypothetical protein
MAAGACARLKFIISEPELAMYQWFFSYNGQQMDPLDHAAAVAQARRKPNGPR